MAEITILNSSVYPIKFFLHYNQEKEPIQSIKLTPFFGNGTFKTLTFPDESINVVISIGIKLHNNSFKQIYSRNINVSKVKYYEFICDLNSSILHELNFNDFSTHTNPSYIKNFILKNSLNFSIEGTFIFDLNGGSITFINENYIINKKSEISFNMPINCAKFHFTVFFIDPNSKLTFKNDKIINSPKNVLPKCYELIKNPLNYSIDLMEYKCL